MLTSYHHQLGLHVLCIVALYMYHFIRHLGSQKTLRVVGYRKRTVILPPRNYSFAEHESICSFVQIAHTKVKTFGKLQDWIYHLGRSAKHGHRKFCGPHECTPERQASPAQHGMRPIASDGIAWFVCIPVCLSVCLSVCVRVVVTNVSRAKMEPIEMLFGIWTRMCPRNHVLDGDAHWRHLADTMDRSPCSGDAALSQIAFVTCLKLITDYLFRPVTRKCKWPFSLVTSIYWTWLFTRNISINVSVNIFQSFTKGHVRRPIKSANDGWCHFSSCIASSDSS